MRRSTIAFGGAVVVLIGLLAWQVVAQRRAMSGPAGGSGTIEATTIRLSSRVGGRIVETGVREGQQVSAGDVLLRLDCIDARTGLAKAEARLAAAREQANAASEQAVAAGAAAGAASESARAADARARALITQGRAADRQAERLDAVLTDVSVSMRDQARASAEGLLAQADAAEASRRAGRAQARAATGRAGAAHAQAAAARLSAQGVQAAQQHAQVTVAECDVTAPRAGTVQMLPWEVGELVGPGVTLATLVDLSTVQATFYLPNADLAAARPGGEATLRADAWPERAFVGTVATVATHAEFTPRNIQTRTDRDRLVYRVEVDVDNPEHALRPGMPVEVRLQETP